MKACYHSLKDWITLQDYLMEKHTAGVCDIDLDLNWQEKEKEPDNGENMIFDGQFGSTCSHEQMDFSKKTKYVDSKKFNSHFDTTKKSIDVNWSGEGCTL